MHVLNWLNWFVVYAAAQQTVYQLGTIVDVLSEEEDFSLLIRLLQRSRLIPTLNLINASTLFAPTNHAIQKQPSLLAALQRDDSIPDNIQAALRRQLLYHCLNYTLDPAGLWVNETAVSTHETLLFPHPDAGHGRPGEPSLPFPGLPLPDGHSLLGGQGQKLRVSTQDEARLAVGVDAAGNGGTIVIKDKIKRARNGIVMAIDDMLQPPPPAFNIIQNHKHLNLIRTLYSSEQLEQYASTANVTLFLPLDKAWAALDPLEWQYLTSGFAQDDLKTLFQDHAMVDSDIGYSDRLLARQHVSTLSGNELSVTQTPHGLVINSSKIVERDIFAENGWGVVQFVENLLLPENSLRLTAEKYLIALNCTKFVSLLRKANLSSVIQDEGEPYTILAPRDDILSGWEGGWSEPSLPAEGSTEMSDLLRYHVLPGMYTDRNLTDGMLVNTLLKTSKLDMHSQKLRVSVSVSIDFASGHKPQTGNSLGFGSAVVIGEPVRVGHSIIYLLSQVLEPPSDVLQTAMTSLKMTTFVAAIYAAQLDKQFKQAAATTFFAPVNKAFAKLGLTMSYLLLPTSTSELKSVMRYHAVSKLAYLNDLKDNEDRLPTLEGSALYSILRNNTIELGGPTVNGFPSSGQLEPTNITKANLLTSTGVLHVTDQVLLPPTLDINIGKLLRGAKATTMSDLVRLANLTWILTGEQPPANFSTSRHKSRGIDPLLQDRSYTLLCPVDAAFNKINLTSYLDDKTALTELVKLHIIPSDAVERSRDPSLSPVDGQPLTLNDDAEYDTLLSRAEGGSSKYGTVAFRQFGADGWMVGIENARSDRHDWARITAFGRATPRFAPDQTILKKHRYHRMAYGGGVLLLDSVLEPYEPGWFIKWGWLVSIVLLSVAAAGCVILLGFKLWRGKKEHVYQVLQDNEED